MKILYAIQGTGNGHLARATEIVPILKSMADTDVLVSGTQADLKVPFKIDYQFSGLSFIIGKKGGVDLWKTVWKMPVRQFIKDIRSLPVEKYDLIINDFEPVSAWACRLRDKECVGLSHQNAVLHPSAPQPEFTDVVGKYILKHYAPASYKYGFNFNPFSPDVFPPVIRHDIRNAESTNQPHYTVYLPAYSDQQIQDVLSRIPDAEWQVFSKHSKTTYTNGNVHFQHVSLEGFTKSFLSCTGLVSTAGFEGPAEAIYMGKKLCVIPMKKQYEQYCNAAYLKSMGIKVLDHFSDSAPVLAEWVRSSKALEVNFPDLTRDILEGILVKHGEKQPNLEFQNLNLKFS
ncbi:MAG TPA: glycosyltransferase family protein [Prolixibacteraceae bacterium]|nr:glycosyltransferase family protein [Prolixibacteraceae bacterium]